MAPSLVVGCRWLVGRTSFHLTVILLILVSIVLLAVEITMPKDNPYHDSVVWAQDVLTGAFVVELLIRFVAYKRRSRFLREYWIDVLAVVASFPVFRIFRLARFLRLLRLLRLFRLATTLTRNSRVLHALLQRRVAEYFLMASLMAFCVLVGTIGLTFFENPHTGLDDLGVSFWTVLFSLMSTQYNTTVPPTLGGKVTILFVLFCGLTFFAVVTGTVSAIMIEKLKEGTLLSRTELEDLEDHVLICGFNTGVEVVLAQLQRHPDFREREFVIIAEREELPEMPTIVNRAMIRHLRDDFTRVDVLKKANAMRASVAVIVSDVSHGRTRQDADARTVLASLTIEKLNPAVHTCAELSNAMNEHHLRLGKVNEVIITQELAGRLLAQAAVDSARSRVIDQLLRPTEGTGLHPYPVEPEYVGSPFATVLGAFPGAIPVAVQRVDGEVLVNPQGHQLADGEILLCVGVPRRRQN